MSRTILLNPGPVTLTEGVKQAMLTHDYCHREKDFADIMLDVIERLSQVYNTDCDYVPVVITGSGSCAVEAMLQTLSPRNGKTLVVCNGVYGERMLNMLVRAGRPNESLIFNWTQAIDIDVLEDKLRADKQITHVVVVHHETTTGQLNDLNELAELCQKQSVELCIDAVSSFGSEVIDFDLWRPLAVAGTANKCLHGVPGISFVLLRKDALELPSQSATLYHDLMSYEKVQREGFSLFTPAVQAVLALQEALRELVSAGGREARYARYHSLASELRVMMKNQGIELLLEGQHYSSSLSSFKLPDRMSYEHIHGILKDSGFIIYSGQGALSGSIFRIANMGDIQDSDWRELQSVLRAILSADD